MIVCLDSVDYGWWNGGILVWNINSAYMNLAQASKYSILPSMNLDVAARSVDLPFPVLHSRASKQTKSSTVAQSLIVTGSCCSHRCCNGLVTEAHLSYVHPHRKCLPLCKCVKIITWLYMCCWIVSDHNMAVYVLLDCKCRGSLIGSEKHCFAYRTCVPSRHCKTQKEWCKHFFCLLVYFGCVLQTLQVVPKITQV